MNHRLGLFALLALLSAAGARAQDGGVKEHPLAGTWKLDPKASSDTTDVLKHFDANFLVKSLASSVSPVNVITFEQDTMKLEVHAVITKRSTLKLDGKAPTGDDMFGHQVSYTSTLEGEAIVSHGTVAGPDGKPERLEMRRTVEPDGRMLLRMLITAEGGSSLEIRRVFNRITP